MQERRSTHRPSPIASRPALAASAVRAWWLRRVNNATQVVFGAIATREPGAMQRALFTFERHCPVPGTMTEPVVLRGAIVETFLRLETALGDCTSSADRASARKHLHDAPLVAPLDQLLAPARTLVAAAHRVRALPLHERVRNWIDEHPDDPRSIGDIATLLGAHPRPLNRHFVRHVGKTVQEIPVGPPRRVRAAVHGHVGTQSRRCCHAVGARSKTRVYRLLHKKARAGASGKLA
jgi:AraC-like DNA-binding protein